MPPSGFSTMQSNHISDYLFSCLCDLKNEGIEYCLSPNEAFKREINNINSIVNSDQYDSLINYLLLLTKEFYIEAIKINVQSYEDFGLIKDSLLPSIENRIIHVKVPVIKVLEIGVL